VAITKLQAAANQQARIAFFILASLASLTVNAIAQGDRRGLQLRERPLEKMRRWLYCPALPHLPPGLLQIVPLARHHQDAEANQSAAQIRQEASRQIGDVEH
jgi:hypothetical protein